MSAPATVGMVGMPLADLGVVMRVVDVKTAWNKVRLLVQPLAGRGEAWVELYRVSLIEANPVYVCPNCNAQGKAHGEATSPACSGA